MWNATLEFSNVPPDTLMDRTMEITLWDACPGPERETFFLGEHPSCGMPAPSRLTAALTNGALLHSALVPGECSVDLQKAFLDDRPVWYRLEDPKCIRAGGKSPHASPRGSLASDMSQRLARNAGQRSFSGSKTQPDL